MDIAKIRKKIKKLEAHDRQKTNEVLQKEKPSRPFGIDSGIKEATKIVDTETKTGQEGAKEPGKVSKTKLPDVGVETDTVPVEDIEILAFKIADEEYAVKMTELQEIIKYQRITAVPGSPKYLIGITSVHGKILPVIDLKDRLGLTDKNGERQKIIIISAKKGPLGALVGAVLGVFRFSTGELLPPPSSLTDNEKNFIEGIVRINNKFISILKVDEILKMEAL